MSDHSLLWPQASTVYYDHRTSQFIVATGHHIYCGHKTPQLIVSTGHLSLLWPQASTVYCDHRTSQFIVVTRHHSLLWPQDTTVSCGHRPPDTTASALMTRARSTICYQGNETWGVKTLELINFNEPDIR